MTTEEAMKAIQDELIKARKKFPPFNSAHEAYAIILEEMDELWDAIKKNDLAHAEKETIQIGAMILSFLTEQDKYVKR